MNKKYSFVFFFILLLDISYAQEQKEIHGIHSLGPHQKWWTITHPFIALRAYKYTKKALAATAEMKKDTALDKDSNGGQVDAFRHSYWMAILSQHINWKKALRLGRVHEKDDYVFYRRDKIEDGSPGDSLASAMDLFNNKAGAEIGHFNRKISETELRQLIIHAILDGKMQVLLKDDQGVYLDCQRNPISMENWKGSWYKPKCLQPSNYRNRKVQ